MYNDKAFQKMVSDFMDLGYGSEDNSRERMLAALFCSCETTYDVACLMEEVARFFKTSNEMADNSDDSVDAACARKVEAIAELLKRNS